MSSAQNDTFMTNKWEDLHMDTRTLRRTAMASMSAVTALSVLAGCGDAGPEKSPTGGNSAAGSQEPTKISIMTLTTATKNIDNTNVIWKELEKRTNTKLDITFVPQSNYPEKFNVSLASGSMPDVVYTDPTSPNFLEAATSGAFWEIGKYYKNYPTLSQYPEDVWLNTKASDGKNYTLPRPRPLDGGTASLSFRQDWLDKLKLKVPETTDEIYNVLKAFVNDDPDGNGQKDTQGLVMIPSSDGTTLSGFHTIFGAFFGEKGLSAYWTVKNGALQSAIALPEMKQAIAYLQKLYTEGLLHKDFAVMKQQQLRDAAMAGKLGAVSEGIPGSWVITEGLKKVIPAGDFTPVTYIKTNSGGKYIPKGSGFNGAYAINKQTVDEAKLKKILAFFDQTSTQEIWELANWGLKDTHFTKEGVAYKATPQAAADTVGQIYMGQVASMVEKYFYAYNAPNSPKERIEANVKRIDEMAKISVADPTLGLVVDSWASIEKDYNKRITDQILKIVLGSDKIDVWDGFVSKMMADEKYKKAEKDMADAYKKKMAK
jgi:putative aldouronate transport system substrate-binding protein